AGGIYDQIGGGFHRYSVDAQWLVPHFEKMLYDNALLTQTYLRAYQATGNDRYRQVAEEVLAYVQREMLSPEGGFYSSQDADSEGEEGRFYVWSADEIDAVLPPEEAAVVREYFGVSEGGNWEGSNILHVEVPREEVAAGLGIPEPRLAELLRSARDRLYEVRAGRVWPGRDEKVITSWNAMMLHAFADAARILDSTVYREVAIRSEER